MDLTPHEQKILDLVKKHPEVLDDRDARAKLADEIGLSEKTLRNRIGDLKKYGVLRGEIFKKKTIQTTFLLFIMSIWRKVILYITIIAFASVVTSLLLPVRYTSSATVISTGSKQQTGLMGLLSGSGVSMPDFGLSGTSEDITVYLSILNSRSLQRKIIREFNLEERYGVEDIERATEKFSDYLGYRITDEGSLVIEVTDKQPRFAKKVVDRLLIYLDSTNVAMRMARGKYNRKFFGQRLAESERRLHEIEDSLLVFQDQYGVLDVPVQVEKTIDTYATIYAQLVQVEIEYDVAKAIFAENDPQLQQKEILIQSLQQRLNTLAQMPDDDVLLAISQIPLTAMKYLRLQRNLEIQNQIMKYLYPQYEQARMEENKNIPSIQILDPPVVPIHKSKPFRALIVLVSTFSGSIIIIIVYYLYWYWELNSDYWNV